MIPELRSVEEFILTDHNAQAEKIQASLLPDTQREKFTHLFGSKNYLDRSLNYQPREHTGYAHCRSLSLVIDLLSSKSLN